MQYLGDFAEDATVYIPFNTFTSDDPQASATITNLADADIMVHKDGGTTQIATDGATVVIDFDSITGNHLITIDTSAHADYATGSEYAVRIEGTTVDAGTINAWVGNFSIERSGGTLALLKNGTYGLSALETLVDGVETAQTTAQNDLDILTGADGATLASAQGNYAPSKAGDAMTLTAAATSAQLVDDLLDEALSGHNAAGSVGKALRQVVEGLIAEESTVNDASATTTSFVTALTEATSSHYSDLSLIFIDGTLKGQCKPIQAYNGGTKVVTLDEAFTEAPANGDGFIILALHVHPVSQIADGICDEALAGHTTAGTLGKAVSDIEVDAGTTLPALLPAALVGGKIDANVGAISSSTTAADNLEASTLGIVPGACEGTPSTTVIQTNLAEATDDHYIGRVVVFTSGNAAGEASDITDYTGASGTITITAITTAPAATDTFVIV